MTSHCKPSVVIRCPRTRPAISDHSCRSTSPPPSSWHPPCRRCWRSSLGPCGLCAAAAPLVVKPQPLPGELRPSASTLLRGSWWSPLACGYVWPWSRRTEVWCALVRDRQQQVIQRRYARAEQRREEVLAAVQSLAISLMGCEVEPDQPLMEAGLDSLGAHSAQALPAQAADGPTLVVRSRC